MGLGRAGMTAVLVLGLAGCGSIGESRFNPFNWFGGPERTANRAVVARSVDPRPLVPVADVVVERTAFGAVIRATGIAPTQGWYGAELVETESPDPGVLAFRLVAERPVAPAPAGPERTRRLIVAQYLSATDLQGIREIRVAGATGTLASRR